MKIRTPTLAEVKAAGYHVSITHNRLCRVAYQDLSTGKLVVKTMTRRELPREEDCETPEAAHKMVTTITELLPKGGLTEVWVTDPDNYNKRDGVNKALERVVELMLVMDGRDGFKMKLTV
jgi:hypothetical protein